MTDQQTRDRRYAEEEARRFVRKHQDALREMERESGYNPTRQFLVRLGTFFALVILAIWIAPEPTLKAVDANLRDIAYLVAAMALVLAAIRVLSTKVNGRWP